MSTTFAPAPAPLADNERTELNAGPGQSDGARRRRPRNRKPRETQGENVVESGEGPINLGGGIDGERRSPRGRGGRRWQPERERQSGQPSGEQANHSAEGANASGRSGRSSPVAGRGGGRRRQGRRPPSNAQAQTEGAAPQQPGAHQTSQPNRGGRRRQINTALTEAEPSHAQQRDQHHERPRKPDAKSDSLTSRLTHSLSIPPYVDCPICFNVIHPDQPIWSCQPGSSSDSPESSDVQCCYTPFHLKCIKSWASKSVKDMREAFRVRGEDKPGEWRCPGCQRRRLHVPQSYICFCGAASDPRHIRLATPHSCGGPCQRSRACGHACVLSCHPGPCLLCQVTTQLPCHCNRTTKSFRCAEITLARSKGPNAGLDLSCGQVCSKPLSCGRHSCSALCHEGECAECPVMVPSKCYCGKTDRELKCGEGVEERCKVVSDGGNVLEWVGRYECENVCGRPFDCGIHTCEKGCHAPSLTPPPCPRSTTVISHCPCGKHRLDELEGGHREKCTDPIATCGNTCNKPLEGCEHLCSVPCHTGPCPPCTVPQTIPCRCGSTIRSLPCYVLTSPPSDTSSLEILCDKPCTALRACGKHQCNRVCCPLAPLASLGAGKGRGKGKKKVRAASALDDDVGAGDEAGWHECDLVCGKLLGCGNHRCEERDHRGICRPCLRSSFEEMICYCGRTIIEPPVPCGTRMSCSFPCSRPPLPCGHPKSPHACHEDPTPCPPCPFLATKRCACGKNLVNNVKCSLERVSCGTTCGKLLDCGFHHCERLCHGGDCGACTTVCGKPRKLCLPAQHGCTAPCHAPAACSEDEPCQSSITLKCPCGRIQQPSLCGRSTSSPTGREVSQQIRCTNECAIAKRNARLAEALGISADVKEREGGKPVTYSDELVTFARANAKFLTLVEKTLADFVNTERKSQVLPYMPEQRRKFVHDLAVIYRIDTQLVDQEPRRSVQLIRRLDTRIPKPLLSSIVNPTSNLGKLADLRAPVASAPVAPRPATTLANNSVGASRGWTSVVSAQSKPAMAQSASHGWGVSPMIHGSAPSSRPATPGNLVPLGSRPVRPASTVAGTTTTTRVAENIPDSWENDDA